MVTYIAGACKIAIVGGMTVDGAKQVLNVCDVIYVRPFF